MYLVAIGTLSSDWCAATTAYLTVDKPTSLPEKSIFFNLDVYDPEGDSRYQVDNLAVELFVKKVFENINAVEVKINGSTSASLFNYIRFTTPAATDWYSVATPAWQRLIHVSNMNVL